MILLIKKSSFMYFRYEEIVYRKRLFDKWIQEASLPNLFRPIFGLFVRVLNWKERNSSEISWLEKMENFIQKSSV